MESTVALLAAFCNEYFFGGGSTAPSGSKSLTVET